MTETGEGIVGRQYQAWGVLVQNSNLKSSHVANGLIQTLRALPGLAEDAPDWSAGEVPVAFDAAVKGALDSFSGDAGWRPGKAAVSLSVTKSKNGSMYLDGDAEGLPRAEARVVEDGLAKLSERFIGAAPRLTRDEHDLLVGALNADGTVMVKGALDPTTPGLSYAGYTSTHTLKQMHAATFLGALARGGETGRGALRALHSLAASSDDVHSGLVDLLGVSSGVEWPSLPADATIEEALPLPTGAEWEAFAALAADATDKLLQWSGSGAEKQGMLMAVVDLMGLLLYLKMMGAAPRPSPAVLLLCHGSKEQGVRAAVAVAQRSLRARQFQLDDDAKSADLIVKSWVPSKAARTLGLATGWLFPRNAQGGARHYLAPGMRQFTTLTRALVAPGEDLPWPEFHDRALNLGVALGGANEAITADLLGAVGSASALRKAGEVNQRFLIQLGLARHESDGVVRVNGGA